MIALKDYILLFKIDNFLIFNLLLLLDSRNDCKNLSNFYPELEIPQPISSKFTYLSKGNMFCKQCLHNLQIMKTRSSSPNPCKLARADNSCQFMKTRSVCRHCLQNEWTLADFLKGKDLKLINLVHKVLKYQLGMSDILNAQK